MSQRKYWHCCGQKYMLTSVLLDLITFSPLFPVILVCRVPQHQIALSSFLEDMRPFIGISNSNMCVGHFHFSLIRNTDCIISQQSHQMKPLTHGWKIIDEVWALSRHRLNGHKGRMKTLTYSLYSKIHWDKSQFKKRNKNHIHIDIYLHLCACIPICKYTYMLKSI